MNLPRTKIQGQRRQELIDAAIAVIAREGISAATIDSIVKQAGQSKGSALYHIKSKQKLYEMVVDHVYTDAAKSIVSAITKWQTPIAKVEAYIRANLKYIFEHSPAIVTVQKIVNEKVNPATAVDSVADATLALQKMLQAGQECGEIRNDITPLSMAIVIRQAIDAASYYIAASPTTAQAAYTEDFTKLYMQAIKRNY